jgi:6-phosphogluconolactonase
MFHASLGSTAAYAHSQGKAEVVQRALEVQTLPGALPVQLVQPGSGKLTWVLDQASAALLRIPEWAEGSKKFPRSENPPKSA